MCERTQLLRATLEQTHPSAQVVAPVSSDRPSEVVELARHASNLGADALLVMMPPFYELDGREQLHFLEWFDRQIDRPFLLYATNDCVSAPPSIALLERALELDWFAAIKDATGDFKRLQSLKAYFGNALRVVNA